MHICVRVCALKCVFVHVGVRVCLHKRHDQRLLGFFYHLPERDIKVIGALSVLVSFPGLDKRDAADTLHLLRVNSHLLRIFLSFFIRYV